MSPPGRSPGSRVCRDHVARRAVPPSPALAEWLLGLAARLRWRDRAGFPPASLEGPFGRHGGGNYASPDGVRRRGLRGQGPAGRRLVSPSTERWARFFCTTVFIRFMRASSSRLENG